MIMVTLTVAHAKNFRRVWYGFSHGLLFLYSVRTKSLTVVTQGEKLQFILIGNSDRKIIVAFSRGQTNNKKERDS